MAISIETIQKPIRGESNMAVMIFVSPAVANDKNDQCSHTQHADAASGKYYTNFSRH